MASAVLSRETRSLPESGPAAPEEGRAAQPWRLRELFRAYRWRMLLTYALFNLENLLRLAQPFVLGLAINGLLRGECGGLMLFVAQHVAYTAIGIARRAYDTRAFTGIYTDLATRLVRQQRGRGVAVSRVAARSALSREFVSFFERDVPVLLHTAYSVVGALAFLCLYDPLLAPLCLGLVLPVALLSRGYSRRSYRLNARLHDELEREVDVIDGGQAAEVRGHYERVARWRVRLSDQEAANFGLTEVFVLGLVALALARSCATLGTDVGSVFAVFRYVLMFVTGIDCVPMLVQQLTRLRDLDRRLGDAGPAAGDGSGQ
jgi:ABC-type multidrug transport system fused ATPase/permease subunit